VNGDQRSNGDSPCASGARVVFDSCHKPTGEPTLREERNNGPPVEIVYPEGLSLYKRGELDDAAMGRKGR
jgi:hypothetical protein